MFMCLGIALFYLCISLIGMRMEQPCALFLFLSSHLLLYCSTRGFEPTSPNNSTIILAHLKSTLSHAQETTSGDRSTPYETGCDKYYCDCNGDRAKCSGEGRRTQYVPRVPGYIRHFRMWHARYPHLTRSMLANISNFRIITLDLAYNKIAQIENETFKDFICLTSLTLSGNPISALDLRASFWSMNRSTLKILHIDGMNISSIPENLFSAFSNQSFQSVYLNNNTISSYKNSYFAMFSRLELLDISHNQIDRLSPDVRINIERIKLDWNYFDKIPDFCLAGTEAQRIQGESVKTEKSAFYKLQYLSLGNNAFKRIPQDALRGVCLPDLEKLDISGVTSLTRLESNFIADLPKLETLIANGMKQLTTYEYYAFNSTSLQKLLLEASGRIDIKSARLSEMFQHCPKLAYVSLSKTTIALSIPRSIRRLLLPLKSAEEINLHATGLGILPADTLWRLPKLKRLIFTGNHINAQDLGLALINVTQLEVLNLQANGISVLDETSLPWEFRRSVKEIDLSRNNFACTCDLLWFRRWLEDVSKNKSIIIRSYPSKQYRCRTPASMLDVPLQNYLPTAESCIVKNPYILIGSVSGCAFILFVVTGTLTYRYRWHLRFYVYRLRRRRRYVQVQRQRLSGEGEMIPLIMYDVYVAHCADDIAWITEELLPVLEGVHGLRVFLEERDSKAGGRRDYNISTNMDKSARIMLVLSDNFMKKNGSDYEWRQFELKEVLSTAIEEDKDVIVLLLGDITPANMTREVRCLLTRGSYLQWSPGDEEAKLFRDGLRVALRTKYGLQSIC